MKVECGDERPWCRPILSSGWRPKERARVAATRVVFAASLFGAFFASGCGGGSSVPHTVAHSMPRVDPSAARANGVCAAANQKVLALVGPARTTAQRVRLARMQITIQRTELRQLRTLPPPSGPGEPATYEGLLAAMNAGTDQALAVARDQIPPVTAAAAHGEAASIADSIGMPACGRTPQPAPIAARQQAVLQRQDAAAAAAVHASAKANEPRLKVTAPAAAICARFDDEIAALPRALSSADAVKLAREIRAIGRREVGLLEGLPGHEVLGAPYARLLTSIKREFALLDPYIEAVQTNNASELRRAVIAERRAAAKLFDVAMRLGMQSCAGPAPAGARPLANN